MITVVIDGQTTSLLCWPHLYLSGVLSVCVSVCLSVCLSRLRIVKLTLQAAAFDIASAPMQV